MNTKTKRVFAGWLNLSDSERQLLMEAIGKFEKSLSFDKRRILEEMEKTVGVVLGPTTGSCPCCGR
ncbi:MAG: hypothetical protein QQN41_04355 [Nitrosopumilus sp.]